MYPLLITASQSTTGVRHLIHNYLHVTLWGNRRLPGPEKVPSAMRRRLLAFVASPALHCPGICSYSSMVWEAGHWVNICHCTGLESCFRQCCHKDVWIHRETACGAYYSSLQKLCEKISFSSLAIPKLRLAFTTLTYNLLFSHMQTSKRSLLNLGSWDALVSARPARRLESWLGGANFGGTCPTSIDLMVNSAADCP